MWAVKTKNYCRQLRDRIFGKIAENFSINRYWIQNHIANCPRCQQRLAQLGRIELAMSLLKSQPHNIDLLKRTNTQAIGVLQHSVRNTAKAENLRNVRPDLSILERCSKYKRSIGSVAACIAIAFIMKGSVFFSAQKFENRSQKAVENYYASNAGEDIARDVFKTNA